MRHELISKWLGCKYFEVKVWLCWSQGGNGVKKDGVGALELRGDRYVPRGLLLATAQLILAMCGQELWRWGYA